MQLLRWHLNDQRGYGNGTHHIISDSRDYDFDLGISVCAHTCDCVHVLQKLTSTGKTTETNAQSKIPLLLVSDSSLFLFTSLPPSLAASLLSLIQFHNKHAQTLSRHIHCFRATKDIPLWEWEYIFRIFGFLLPENAIAEEKILQSL